jgi:hypothetical protein
MRHRRITGPTALAASLIVVVSTMAPTPAGAAPAPPSLRLIAAQQNVTLVRFGKGPVGLDVGAYVASVGGTFQVNVTRAGYRAPIRASQVVHTGAGTQTIPLPDGLVKNWTGLSWFLKITVTDHNGNVVATRHPTFCPDTYDQQRVSPNGPTNPTFPQYCSANPFTLGMVWGIDDGWAVNPITSSYTYPQARLPNGRYTVTVAFGQTYQALFGIAPEDAQVTVNARVRSGSGGGCPPFCPVRAHRRSRNQGRLVPSAHVPTTTHPDPSTEPDLVALPAWGINTDHQNRRDYLDFGATVWNRGPAPMVVEGFRRLGDPIMNGWEYFFDPDGTTVGRARVGTLKYDARPGHEHWHFQQFATYQLLDANRKGIVFSDKEGFCLAPTDAIDLAVPGADWNPGQLGFGGSVCGSANSIWTRETLPTGWGDTYFQGLPGQSFDITHLRNGTYFIAVKANPTGELFERSTKNNVRYRKVILGGKPGARTVTVPPWNGIDTEGGRNGGGIAFKPR